MPAPTKNSQKSARARVEQFRNKLGPFVVAAEATQIPKIFTDGQETENCIVFANDAFLTLIGLRHDAILGVPFHLLIGSICDSSALSSMEEVMAVGGTTTFEMQCRRNDKSEFLVTVFLSPMRADGTIVKQYCISFVESEVPLGCRLNQRDEFRALYEHAPGFITAVEGPDHRFTFANASYKQFVGRERLVGLTAAEAMPELVRQGFIDILDQVYGSGKPFAENCKPIEIVNPTTGLFKTRYFDCVYQPVRNANNVVTGIFCAGHDVTVHHDNTEALFASQAKLIHVSRVNTMGAMATTLAHELNQPLSAITIYTAGILRVVDPAAKDAKILTDAVKGIGEAAQHAIEIIRHLRELTGRRDPTKVEFNLKSAVEECLRLVHATASAGVRIDDRLPDKLTMVADRVQIQQVLINLLGNACDAVLASDRQRVSISAKAIDGKIVVSVIDSGPGVPIGIAADIFMWRESTKEGSMGFGLSICRTIVEAHHGSIWLENSSKSGSEFCFSVPRH